MVSRNDIEAQVSAYLTKQFLAKGVKLEGATPFAEFGIDSMTVVELVMFIEEEFGVAIPANQLTVENLSSLEALVNCAITNQR
jgi:acyl carrier protein